MVNRSIEEYQTLLEKVIIVSVSERAIGFGGSGTVSFSQQGQSPNLKVWNMDCTAAAYHDVSFFLALADCRSLFCLAHKRSTR